MVQCPQSSVRQHRGVCLAHVQPRKRRLYDHYTIFLSSHFAYRSCSLRNTVSMPLSSCFACGSHSPTGHIIHDAAQRPQQNRTSCVFAWFNVLKALCASTGACALHMRSRASGGLEVIIPHPPAGFIRSFSNHLTNFVSTCYNKVMATAGCRNGTPSWWPRARAFVRMKSEGGPVPASLFLRRTQL